MNTDKDQLMNQINSIMNSNKPAVAKASKADREIIYFESELLANNVLLPFHQKISELAPEFANDKFGTGSFSREDYALGWEKVNDKTFRFSLTNIPHSNKKVLADCPAEFKEDLYRLLPRFIENIAYKAKESLKS